jgi:hypothetical protein
MNPIELLTTLEGGIRSTHFFNGRLLTAEDLQVEQMANRLQHQRLGRAIGEGVVYGLEVEPAPSSTVQRPVLRVTTGLALNRQGEVIAVAADVNVALVREAQAQAVEGGVFAECVPPQPQTTLPARGFYVLTARPASGFEGRAPVVGLSAPGVATECGRGHSVVGVKFCLVPLPVETAAVPSALRAHFVQLISQLETQLTQLPLLSGTIAEQRRREILATRSQLRNTAAYLCFGTESLTAFPDDPFTRTAAGNLPYGEYGVLDELRRQGGLTESDVPLALLYWTVHGVQFLDMWAVRRRLVQPLTDSLWPLHVGQRRLAEAEAMFLQFQAQVREMVRQESNLSATSAPSRFRYLPPAGYIPLGARGFRRDLFFAGLEVEPAQVDVAFLRLLIQQAWFLEPVDLANPPPLRLYEVPDNPDYVLFVRRERRFEPEKPQVPPEPGTTPSTGRIDIEVDVSEALKSSEAVRLLFTPGKRFREEVEIKVWAEDELGKEYQATFVPKGSSIRFVGEKELEFDRGIARFTIRALPPGTYKVRVRMKGFKEASQSRTLNAGQTVRVVFWLVPDTKPPGGRIEPPKDPGKGRWISPQWYDKVVVFDKYIKWPWPPKDVIGFDPVIDPPPFDVQKWVQDWGDWITSQYPDAPVNPGDIRIYVDRSHAPDVRSQDPYAYLVFGEGGAYVPVVLTPVDRTLDRPVSVTKAGLAGVDRDVEDRFKAVGLTEVDVLGASWTGLIVDAVGIGIEAASSLIGEAREGVDGLQGSLRIFSGVGATLENNLRNAGITDTVRLANADPQALAAQLREQGVTVAFAQRLVDEARRAVPEDTWSLRTQRLGLKDREIAALQALGITTQGALKTRAEGEEQARIAEAVGISREALRTLIGSINVEAFAAELRRSREAGAPTTSVVGVNREVAKTLATIGIGTVGDLAVSDVNIVARAFAGDAARAAEVINAARAKASLG